MDYDAESRGLSGRDSRWRRETCSCQRMIACVCVSVCVYSSRARSITPSRLPLELETARTGDVDALVLLLLAITPCRFTRTKQRDSREGLTR
jgi:hypothetical protein